MGKPSKLAVFPEGEHVDAPSAVAWETADKMAEETITWLLPGRIVAGAVNIVEGEKGAAKSTFIAAIVASVTSGSKLLGRKKSAPAAVLYLAGEDDPGKIVRKRMQAAGADLSRVHFPPRDEFGIRQRLWIPASVDLLRDTIPQLGLGLVVIDPLSSHVPQEVDLRSDQSIHAALDPLAALSAESGCTFILARNLTKNTAASRIDRGLGGAGVAGVARSVLVVDWPDRRKPRRVLRLVACNLSPGTPAAEFVLRDKGGWPACTGWKVLHDDQDNEDELMEPGDRSVMNDAKTLLRKLLPVGKWVPAKAAMLEAEGAGISLRTLNSAKGQLGVRTRSVRSVSPARWEWAAPLSGW